MRNKDRIRPFCERLAAAWERCPDMRFGQLICNAFSVSNTGACKDPFFVEDDVTIFLIEKLTDKSPYYPSKEES